VNICRAVKLDEELDSMAPRIRAAAFRSGLESKFKIKDVENHR
jgi:hypothetical protein